MSTPEQPNPSGATRFYAAHGSAKFHVQYRNRLYSRAGQWLAWTRWSIDTTKEHAEELLAKGRVAAGFEELRIAISPNDKAQRAAGRKDSMKTRKTQRPADSLRRMVRELPEDATCADCGNTAANSGCSRSLEEIDATDRNFIEHWSKWKDGKHFILGSEPEETFPLDAKGKKWEVCNHCGCPRWNLPNDKLTDAGTKTL